MKIRKATVKDFEEVLALWRKAGLSTANKKREHLEYGLMIKRNPTSCLIALDHDSVVGTVFGAFNGRRAWIYHLAVDPAYQGKGLGRRLVNEVERKLKATGATKIIIGVGIDNLSTVPFYQKSGFKVMYDAILFAKDLLK